MPRQSGLPALTEGRMSQVVGVARANDGGAPGQPAHRDLVASMTILKYGEDAASDLRDLDGMGRPRPVEVALGNAHDLGLSLQAPEASVVDDAGVVAPVLAAHVARATLVSQSALLEGLPRPVDHPCHFLTPRKRDVGAHGRSDASRALPFLQDPSPSSSNPSCRRRTASMAR